MLGSKSCIALQREVGLRATEAPNYVSVDMRDFENCVDLSGGGEVVAIGKLVKSVEVALICQNRAGVYLQWIV